MKRLFSTILTALALFIAAGCVQEQPDGAKYLVDNSLAVLSHDIFFQPGGGTGSIVVDAEGTVTAASNKSWLTVSVNGNTVNLTASENPDIESRYAEVSISSGSASTVLIAQQYGYKTVSFNVEDIVADSRSHTYSFPYSYDSEMEVTSSVDWITATAVNVDGAQSIKVELAENTTGQTREGVVSWKLGVESGEFKVTQYPAFNINSAWTLVYDRDEDVNSILVAEGPEGPFAIDLMKKAAFDSKYNSAYELFAVDVVAAADPAHLFTETGDVTWAFLEKGTYAAVMVGVDEEYNPTGEYNYFEIEVERANEKSPYEKWLGKWEITYVEYEYNDSGQKTGEKEVTHTWEIKQKVADVSYTISGVSSTENEFGDVIADFDAATNALSVLPQLTLETTYSGNPDLYYFCAMFGESNLLYSGEIPIFTAVMDGDTATLTPGEYQGNTFHSAATLNLYSSKWYLTTGRYDLPNSMKLVEPGEGGGEGEGGEEGGEGYASFLGSWTDGTDTYTITQATANSTYTVAGFGLDVKARYNNGILEFYGQELGSDDNYSYYFYGVDQDDYLEKGAQDGTDLLAKGTIASDGSLKIVGHEYVATYSGVDYDEIIVQLGIFGEASDGKTYGFNDLPYLDLPATLTPAGSGAPRKGVAVKAQVVEAVKSASSSYQVRMPKGVFSKR